MIELRSALDQMEREGSLRRLPAPSSRVDFCSNDYLGLAYDPRIREGLCAALSSGLALGATGSRLLGGNSELHLEIETELARMFGRERALLFSSGFAANLGVMSALGNEETVFFSDQLNHASLIDGMRLTPSQRRVYRHNDLNHLEELMRASAGARRRVIVTESVFSMDGDLAPLSDLRELANRFDAWLVIDEAHATGVFGENGLGLSEGFDGENVLTVHTGGKALGAQGAFVVGSRTARDWLVNRARSFIYSTAISPLLAVQLRLALRVIIADGGRMGRTLREMAEELRQHMREFSEVGTSTSQIIPVITGGGNTRVLQVAESVRERGLEVRAIRSPTVAQGAERLRITLRLNHSAEERARLLLGLKEGMTHAQ